MNNETYQVFFKNHPALLDFILFDNTTKKNIIWATDSYKEKGYKFFDNISSLTITDTNIIIPRSNKIKDEQVKRSRDSGEVFTPSWMCNKQNNIVDELWFKRKDVFNKESGLSWETKKSKIKFPNGKTWLDYVKEIRLEISCGEAPYVVSRYDSVNGEYLNVENRIGLLDRKLRVINENTCSKSEWIDASLIALKSVYGYELQGDNLILARINILFSIIDFYKAKFNDIPSDEYLYEASKIISWNFWQMDGLKAVIPGSCKNEIILVNTIFGIEKYGQECTGCINNDISQHNGKYCYIMNWNTGKREKFVNLLNNGGLKK